MKQVLISNKQVALKVLDRLRLIYNIQSGTQPVIRSIDNIEFKNKITKTMQSVPYAIIWAKDTISSNKLNIVNSIHVYKRGKLIKILHLNCVMHPNVSPSTEKLCEVIHSMGRQGVYKIAIMGQEMCIPVRCRNITLQGSEILVKGYLSGSNPLDSYRIPDSVSNSRLDKPLRKDGVIKTLRNCSLFDLIQKKFHECNPSDVFYKPIDLDHYVGAEDMSEDTILSDYYPTIHYKMLTDYYNLKYKPIQFDVGVVGLGSGGTTVLDQLVRSNFFNDYLLCDFDTVEQKNLNNQWYNKYHIGKLKVNCTKSILHSINPSLNIKGINKPFEQVPLNYSYKYLIIATDDIPSRLQIIDKIIQGSIRADYIIDQRYLDLTCSIYLINTQDPDQLKYYRNLLIADGEAFAQEDNDTIQENTCIKHNYIDIYRYVGSIIFSAIREIESRNKQSFVHIEAQSEVIPSYLKIKEVKYDNANRNMEQVAI